MGLNCAEICIKRDFIVFTNATVKMLLVSCCEYMHASPGNNIRFFQVALVILGQLIANVWAQMV
jgi:hypothetical protein